MQVTIKTNTEGKHPKAYKGYMTVNVDQATASRSAAFSDHWDRKQGKVVMRFKTQRQLVSVARSIKLAGYEPEHVYVSSVGDPAFVQKLVEDSMMEAMRPRTLGVL